MNLIEKYNRLNTFWHVVCGIYTEQLKFLKMEEYEIPIDLDEYDISLNNIMKFLWDIKWIVIKTTSLDIDDFASGHNLPPICKYMEDFRIIKNIARFKTPKWVWIDDPTPATAQKIRNSIINGGTNKFNIDVPEGLTKLETKIYKFIHRFNHECNISRRNVYIGELYEEYGVDSSYAHIISNYYAWNSSGIRGNPEWLWRDGNPLTVKTVRSIIKEARELVKKNMEGVTSTVCTKCKKCKPIKEFSKDWGSLTGYASHCKECQNK